MQNCSWTLDESVHLPFIPVPGRYIIGMKSTIARSACIRSGCHLAFDRFTLINDYYVTIALLARKSRPKSLL